MENEKKKDRQENNFMLRMANIIVDKRNLFFLIFTLIVIFSIFSTGWVKVENKLTAFLPDNARTTEAMDVMGDQFVTYGMARVMVDGISVQEAKKLNTKLSAVDGVMMVEQQ